MDTSPVTAKLFQLIVPLLLKTTIYIVVFRLRKHRVRMLTCTLLGGAAYIVAGFVVVPAFLQFAAAIGIAVYILRQYTEVPLMPEGLIIILGIETGFALLYTTILLPLLL